MSRRRGRLRNSASRIRASKSRSKPSRCTSRSRKSEPRTRPLHSTELWLAASSRDGLGSRVQIAGDEMMRDDFEEFRLQRRQELEDDAAGVESDPRDRAERDSIRPRRPCSHERLHTQAMRFGGRLAVTKEEDLVPADRHFLEWREIRRFGIPRRIEQVCRGRRHIPRTPAAMRKDDVATRVEPATRGGSEGTGGGTGKADSFPPSLRIGDGDGGEERLRVRVHWIGEQLGRSRPLEDPAEVHDRDTVRHVPHHAEVVRDEEVREVLPLLYFLEEVQDLGLDRHIEGAGRFVEEQELRFRREGAGNRDALTLAPGELVREAVEVLGSQADLLQQTGTLFVRLRTGRKTADQERLRDDVLDEQARIQRGERVLEDGLHETAERLHRPAAQPGHRVLAEQILRLPVVTEGIAATRAQALEDLDGHVEEDIAFRGLDEAQQEPPQGGFTATGLADQRDRFPAANHEVDAIDGADGRNCPLKEAASRRKTFLQPSRGQEDFVPVPARSRHSPPPPHRDGRQPFDSDRGRGAWAPRSDTDRRRRRIGGGNGSPVAASTDRGRLPESWEAGLPARASCSPATRSIGEGPACTDEGGWRRDRPRERSRRFSRRT